MILPAKDRIETEAITANKNRKKRILTIDDDKDTSSSLKIVLEQSVVLEQSGLFEVSPNVIWWYKQNLSSYFLGIDGYVAIYSLPKSKNVTRPRNLIFRTIVH